MHFTISTIMMCGLIMCLCRVWTWQTGDTLATETFYIFCATICFSWSCLPVASENVGLPQECLIALLILTNKLKDTSEKNKKYTSHYSPPLMYRKADNLISVCEDGAPACLKETSDGTKGRYIYAIMHISGPCNLALVVNIYWQLFIKSTSWHLQTDKIRDAFIVAFHYRNL